METLVFCLFFTSFGLSTETLGLRLKMESMVWSKVTVWEAEFQWHHF